MDDSSARTRLSTDLRRHWLALTLVAGLLLLYTLGGFLLLPRIVRSQAIQYVQHTLGGRQLSIGALHFNPFSFAVQIDNLSLREPDNAPIASFAHLRLRFDAWRSLLHRAWSLGEFTLDQPSINALVNADGSLNLAKLQPPSATAPTTEPKALPALRIAALTVSAGQLRYEDRSRGGQPFVARLTPIEFSLRDFRTQAQFQNRYQFAASTAAGEQLSWSGEFSLQPLGSSGEFAIHGLKAATLVAYVDSLPFAVPSGSFDLAGSYRLVAAADTDLSVTLPSLQVHELAIAPRNSAVTDTPWVRLPEFDFSDIRVQLAQRRVDVGRAALHNLSLQAWRAADGSINLQQLLAPASDGGIAAAPTPTPAAATAATPWHVALDELNLDGATISLQDRSVTPSASLQLSSLTFNLKHYASDYSQPLALDWSMGVNDSGHFSGQGTLSLAPLSADFKLDLSAFNLAALQPYLTQRTAMTIDSGRLGVQAQIHYASQPAHAQSPLSVQAAIDLSGLDTHDRISHSQFISWRDLAVTGVRYQQRPDALSIQRVHAVGAYARVIIAANGALNISEILGAAPTQATGATANPPTSALAPAPQHKTAKSSTTVLAPAAPKASALRIRVARIDVEDGTANFADHSIQPNFASGIVGLHGSISGLSSDPSSRAQILLEGSVDKYAPVSIMGEANLLAATTYTDIGLKFSNMELTTFNPYSGKFAGYSIERGKLTTELHYHIDKGQLQATHHVVIDQLEFGAATDSKQAVPLPIRLAAALLKDRNGVISLDLPVTGSLDDPNFHIAPVVWQLLKGLLTKIVTAPFALLGSLFGGGEQMSYIDFPAGGSTLSDADTQKLTQLSKALVERPQLKLDIPLHALSAADDPALAEADLQRALMSAAARDASSTRKRTLTATADPQLATLAKLYHTQFQAEPVYPDALVPAADPKAKPDPAVLASAQSHWLSQQLLSKYAPGPEQRDRLARARAEAVQTAILSNTELQPDRVFLTDRSSGAGGAEQSARMELKLQ